MDNYITLPIENCVNFNHVERTFCLPIKTACNNTVVDGLFTNNQWNCNKKCSSDKDYFITVPPDGKIMFQTNFNTGRAPSGGWGDTINISLFDEKGILVTENHELFSSRSIVAHSGKLAYQTIEIDFSKITNNCGHFEITFGETTIKTHHYKIDDCACLIEIEGLYSGYDCWKNYYGLPNGTFIGNGDLVYSNKIYLEGSVKYFGTSNTNGNIKEILRFTPKSVIAPFMERYLSFKLLKPTNATVQGELWNNTENSFTPREKSSMFWPIISFEKKGCLQNNACSN